MLESHLAEWIDLVISGNVEIEMSEVGETTNGTADIERGEEQARILGGPFGELCGIVAVWQGDVQHQVLDLLENVWELSKGREGGRNGITSKQSRDLLLAVTRINEVLCTSDRRLFSKTKRRVIVLQRVANL